MMDGLGGVATFMAVNGSGSGDCGYGAGMGTCMATGNNLSTHLGTQAPGQLW